MVGQGPSSLNYFANGIGTRNVIGISEQGKAFNVDIDKDAFILSWAMNNMVYNHFNTTFLVAKGLGAKFPYDLNDINNMVYNTKEWSTGGQHI